MVKYFDMQNCDEDEVNEEVKDMIIRQGLCDTMISEYQKEYPNRTPLEEALFRDIIRHLFLIPSDEED